jgi:hypothetical protein
VKAKTRVVTFRMDQATWESARAPAIRQTIKRGHGNM